MNRAWWDRQRQGLVAKIARAFRAYIDSLRVLNDRARAALVVRTGSVSYLRGLDEAAARFGQDVQAAYLAEAMSLRDVALFDPTSWRALVDLRTFGTQLATALSDDQRDAVNRVIAEGSRDGLLSDEMERLVLLVLGLSFMQAGSLLAYRRLLAENDVASLVRELRDTQYDDIVRDHRITPELVRSMTSAYAGNSAAERIRVIGETEAQKVLGSVTHTIAWQGVDRGEFDENQISRTWWTVGDELVRGTHKPLHGVTVYGLRQPYVTGGGVRMMHPGDTSAPVREIAGCRCNETISLR